MSLKVIHFADVHLGIENYGRLDPQTGLSTRLTDFLRSIDAIVDTALDEAADLVVFCGDAYKTRDPSPTYQREFARRIQRLSHASVPMVLVAGNHDVPNAVGRAHTMEIYRTLEVEHVYVARSPGVLDIETVHGAVQVGVLPWIVRSNLLSRDDYKNRSLDEVNGLLLERIEMILTGEDGLVSRLRDDVPHILVVHGTVQGATYGSERTVMLGQDVVLPLQLLKHPSWDYVALGHIHRHQAIEPERAPPVVYSGSIERIDFGEEKEDKGFVVAEVERGSCSWAFRKLDVRPFLTVRVTADGDDPTGQILAALERAPIEDAVVRLIVRTTADRDVLIRENEVRRALDPAFYIAAILHDVVRPERMRLGAQEDVAGLTPLEALERYLQVRETSRDRLQVLMHHAELLVSTHEDD
ncbi:MAG TPA: exonuclease SbcCD subunit D [Anaerolineae bacterium]|nr:exonuclease SbcCD subunit D [Anaerolineae bacterium]